jgi:hypothetical protein
VPQSKVKEIFTAGNQVNASNNAISEVIESMRATISGAKPPAATERESFRTASVKQDESESWVHPGFRGVNQLYNINMQLKSELESAAENVLNHALGEVERSDVS